MVDLAQADTFSGRTLLGSDGEKIGRIDTLYVDENGQDAKFVTVNTGLFGTKTSFVPVAEARLQGEDVVVPYSKDQVKQAPNVEVDEDLTAEEEERLYSHYGMSRMARSTTGADGPGRDDRTEQSERPDREPVGRDTSGPTTDDAMTRSEERLRVGTEQQEVGRARLRKYIVTENVTTTVPVRREEVRIEREPIADGNADRAMDGPALSEEEHEVILTEERPVVTKETVPVERVRLATDTVTEEVEVSEQVRQERIDTDDVYPDRTEPAREQEKRR